MRQRIRIALAGNPNSGKTTVFNAITGARHHVGNYPGVTVEKREGTRLFGGALLEVLDLPGTYSLAPRSIEETIARDCLLGDGAVERPDVVVDVIDCSNLERSLYLSVQLLEVGLPVVLAFNMSDVARSRGTSFDLGRLSESLGVPIVPTVGHRGDGIDELLSAAVRVATHGNGHHHLAIDYGADIERAIGELEPLIAERNGRLPACRRRSLALNLIEDDGEGRSKLRDSSLAAAADAIRKRLAVASGDTPSLLVAHRRYNFISDLCERVTGAGAADVRTASDRIDAVLLSRFLGVPIFLAFMYLVFQLTFTVADPAAGWIEAGVSALGRGVAGLWPGASESLLRSLIVDGIIGGVGSVIVFLPNIVMLFMAIAVLEDSGYMARAAFIMDRLMGKVGLHGKSFIPMLLGFGCNVPAIMATRTLESRRDRMTTMLVIPLMLCSARFTIYALVIPAFFPLRWQAPVLWIMYVIGIVLAIGLANLLRATAFRGESRGFLMELPPYRMPTARTTLIHMWERVVLYVRKAGTVILAISIVLWALMTFPRKPLGTEGSAAAFQPPTQTLASAPDGEQHHEADRLAYSLAGRLGHAMEPLIRPMGFDWRIGTALIGAFAAREVFIAQMGIVYSIGVDGESSDALRSRLRQSYSPLVGFCIMLFTLIAPLCMATVAITRRESNSWAWALFQFGALTTLAYVITVMIYQAGRFLGIGV